MEEQFNAFAAGFHELIPPDLVNVFDERELELLIGGIADIDIADWKKHTDYRGYEETSPVIQNFWTVRGAEDGPGPGLCLTCWCSASKAGTPNRSRVSYNSPRVPLEYRSTGSKICREATGQGGSLSRTRARRMLCRSPTHGMSRCSSTSSSCLADVCMLTWTLSFNRLDLPAYDNFHDLQQKLTIAVEETVGFGQE